MLSHLDHSGAWRRRLGRARRALRTGIAGAGLVAAALMAGALPASAHPHVWVTVETTVLYDKGTITGFRHSWTFDEFYTAMAIQGLDANKDGVYSREELAELAQVNIDGLKDFAFFTFPRLAGQPVAVEAPKDYALEHRKVTPPKETQAPAGPGAVPKDGAAAPKGPGMLSRLWQGLGGEGGAKPDAKPTTVEVLTLTFTLPLKQPVLADAPDFTFAVYDPSFFIAFDLAKQEPVRLGQGAPAGCRVERTADVPPSGDDAQRIGDALTGQLGGAAIGYGASRPIKIICGPKT